MAARRQIDAELSALLRCQRILAELGPAARERVVEYFASRHIEGAVAERMQHEPSAGNGGSHG